MTSIFVVAITRWGRPLQEEAAALAPLFGVTAYDLRLKLGGPLPVLVDQTSDPQQASSLLSSLQQRGHGAVACDLSKVARSTSMFMPRDFSFEASTFVSVNPEHGEHRIAYDHVLALIRAVHAVATTTIEASRQRKLSASRAILTGGLVMSKTVEKKHISTTDEREQALYLFGQPGAEPLLLTESGLRYTGLGDRMGPTKLANFATTVALLREHAPGAFYDERLLTQRRRSSSDGATASNVDATDLAAHLLMLARLGGQL